MHEAKDKYALVITSTGHISREVHHVMDRPENFYVQGSMGAALPLGIGLALNTNRMVMVIIGDGDALMSLDSMVLMKKLDLPNLKLFILDNNEYESTGGQPTCSMSVEFRLLCYCSVIFVEKGGKTVPRIDIPHKKIKERFMKCLKK